MWSRLREFCSSKEGPGGGSLSYASTTRYTEIVRTDSYRRYDRECDAPIKEYDTDIEGWEDAERFLRENWRQFAARYFRRHGHDVRDDGKNA